jgi:hypothetical protein
MRRSFGFDVLARPQSEWRLRLVALIEDAGSSTGSCANLGLPTEVPAARPARAPPISAAVVSTTDDESIPADTNS